MKQQQQQPMMHHQPPANDAGSRDTTFMMEKVKGFGPYIPWTTCGCEQQVLEITDSVLKGTQVTIVTGPIGSGKNSCIREAFEAMRQSQLPQAAVPIPTFRQFALMLCDNCNHVSLLPPGEKSEELLTRGTLGLTVGHTASGISVTSGEVACKECKKGMYDLIWMKMPDDEFTNLEACHSKTPEVKNTCVLTCSNCKSSGIPFTPEGMCTYNNDGSITSCNGEAMPEVDSHAWLLGMPHLSQQCQTAHLIPTRISLSLDVSCALNKRKVSALHPRQPDARGVFYLEIADLGLTTGDIKPNIQTLSITMGDKARRVLKQPLDDNAMNVLSRGTENETLRSWEQYAAPVSIRVAGNIAYYLPRFNEGNVGADGIVRAMQGGSTIARSRFIIGCQEEDVNTYVETFTKAGLTHSIVRVPERDSKTLYGMMLLYINGVEEFTRHNANDEANVDKTARLQENRSFAKTVCNVMDGQSLLAHVAAINYLRLVRTYAPKRLSKVLQSMPKTHKELVFAALDLLGVVHGCAVLKWLVRVVIASTGASLDFLTSFCQILSPEITQDNVKELLRGLVGILLTPRASSFGGYNANNSHSSKMCMEWANQGLTHNDETKFFLTLGGAARDVLETTYAVGMAGTMFFCYVKAGAYDRCLSALQDWNVIHGCMHNFEVASIRYGIDSVKEHYTSSHFRSNKIVQDIEQRWQFILNNVVTLFSDDSWKIAQSQYTQLTHGDDVATIARGQNLEGEEPPKQLVRIFTSSTFDDLKEERNALMERSYPVLREKLGALGLQFQVVDMRWGIRDESTNDHKTTAICMEEIRECQEKSLGPNFVTLLSQRYGYRPFPAVIDKDELDKLVSACSQEDADLIHMWFKLDANVVPSVYRLLPVTDNLPYFMENEDKEKRGKDRGQWWAWFDQMCGAFRSAADVVFMDNHNLRHKYYFSITEEEIRRGILDLTPEARENQCLWLRRNITNLEEIAQKGGDKRVGAFIDMAGNKIDDDAHSLLAVLREDELPSALPSHAVLEYDVQFEPNQGIDPKNMDHASYINRMVDEFTEKMIDTVEANLRIARSKLSSDENIAEILTHNKFVENESALFCGRKELLQSLLDKLKPSSSKQHPVVVTGPEGCGKSCLIAKACSSLLASTCVVSRFIGISSQSGNLRPLVESLVFQISAAYGKTISISTDFTKTRDAFEQILSLATKKQPLLIVIDGLDRLGTSEEGRHLEKWIPNTLPPYVSFVIGLSAEIPDTFIRMYDILEDTNSVASNIIEVPMLSADDVGVFVESTLSRNNQALTNNQKDQVKKEILDNPSALYAKMSMSIALKTKSDDEFIQYPDSKEGILNQLLDEMEVTHGQFLVKHTIAYITLAFEGVTSAELEDLLSLDDDVLNDVFQYWEPPIRRLPPLLLVRVLRDIRHFIGEVPSRNGVPVYQWKFRSFERLVLKRYFGVELPPLDLILSTSNFNEWNKNRATLSSKQQSLRFILMDTPASDGEKVFHTRLAEYFQGKWHKQKKPFTNKNKAKKEEDRFVASMPTIFSRSVRADYRFFRPNSRKILELPFHHLRLQDMSALERTWADPENLAFFVRTCGFSGDSDLFPLVKKYTDTITISKTNNILKEKCTALMAKMNSESEVNDIRYTMSCIVGVKNMYIAFQKLSTSGFDWIVEYSKTIHDLNNSAGFGSKTSDTTATIKEVEMLLQKGKLQDAVAKAQQNLAKAYSGQQLTQEGVGLMIDYAKLFLTAGVIQVSIQYLQVLEQVVPNSSFDDAYKADFFTLAVTIYQQLQQFPKALQFAQEGYQFSLEKFGQDSPRTIVMMNNLGGLFYHLGNFGQAEDILTRSFQIAKVALSETHSEYLTGLSTLGAVYMGMAQSNPQLADKMEMAVSTLESAVSAIEKMETIEDPELLETSMSIYNNLAHAYTGVGRPDEGFAAIDRGVERCSDNREGNIRKGKLLTQKSLLYINAQRFNEGLIPALQAHQVLKDLFGESDPEIGQSAECTAICLQQTGQAQKSLPYVELVKKLSGGRGTMF
eukprot:m.101938 g.101938  ORF g.101938 m.101938 type:complete len:2017 (+) comp9070_c1_seq1:232-6282(+)